jgi:hypothetical protein
LSDEKSSPETRPAAARTRRAQHPPPACPCRRRSSTKPAARQLWFCPLASARTGGPGWPSLRVNLLDLI